MSLTLDMVPAACQSEPGSVLEFKSSLVDVENAEPVCVLYISQSTHMLMLCINAYSFHPAAGGLPRPDKAGRGVEGGVVSPPSATVKSTSADSGSPLIHSPL